MTDNQKFLTELKSLLGESGVIEDPAELAPFNQDWRGIYKGQALAVARPKNTQQVAEVVKLCQQHQLAIVPQGGNTGLCGGAVPDGSGQQLVLSLARLNQIREIDPVNNTMVVEAGCILAELQQRAAEHDRLFPLSLGAEGSCQIGGNLSTNAGGVNVLRYGNSRDLVLGLEVVLPDGEIWHGLNALRKDNTGYDLKQLFVGSEGTLGIITAAVLKLFPRPRSEVTVYLAIPDVTAAITILGKAQAQVGSVSSVELMPRLALEMVLKHIPNKRDPFTTPYSWYLLLQFSGAQSGNNLREEVETCLGEFYEEGLVLDAVIAENQTQAAELWSLRENISEAQRHEGAQIKHDISVPVSKIPEFMADAEAQVNAQYPGTRIVAFGHMGDGNIHFNLSQPLDVAAASFQGQTEAINNLVHGIAHRLKGSISAEHGLGQLKVEEITHYKSTTELHLMRKIKQALDPDNRLNPGKVLRVGD